MKTIIFSETRVFRRAGKPDVTYEAGSTHTLRDDQARRWINRGAAVEVKDGVVVAPAAKPAPETEKTDPRIPVDFQASRGSQAFLKGDDPNDGDTLARPADVLGKDGGDPGKRAELIPRRGLRGAGGGTAGGGNK